MLLALLVATAAPQLPKATALPPPDQELSAILAPIDAVFAAFEKGDGAEVMRHVYPQGRVTAVGLSRRGNGVRHFSWTEFAQGLDPDNGFQERISDPAIEVDGDIAMVWAPFVVRVRGKVQNCGVDHFDLVRENGNWKIMNITFSTRITGCPAQ